MTIEELLEASIEVQEKMTDKELLELFEPFLNVTRPERIVKQKKEEERVYITPAQQKAMEFLGANGVDTSLLFKKKKKL